MRWQFAMISEASMFDGLIQIFDIRKPDREVKMKIMAHSKTIMRIAWHPTKYDILASGSRDHSIKLWNCTEIQTPLRSIMNVEPVDRLQWIPSPNSVQMLGVGTVMGDSALSIWDIQDPFVVQYTFKTDSKNKIIDVVFSNKHAVYSTKSGMLVLENFEIANKVRDERRGNPLCCSIRDSYAFAFDRETTPIATDFFETGSVKTEDRPPHEIHFMNVHSFGSCYQQRDYFQSAKDEILYFVKNYQTLVQSDVRQTLRQNAELCEKVGKTEISTIWRSLLIMLEKDREVNPNLNRQETEGEEDADQLMTILDFYKQNQDRFLVDIRNKRVLIDIKTGSISIHKDYEPQLIQELGIQTKAKSKVLPFEDKVKVMSQIISELIDNGEFIHGFQMYNCLQSFMTNFVDKQTQRVWTTTYIDLLVNMELFNEANDVIKRNSSESFSILQNKVIPGMTIKCNFCKAEIEPMKGGVCQKCSSQRICCICQKKVKGLYLWCQICGHGGHYGDMTRWFSQKDASCPTGCGHTCFKFYKGDN